MKNEKIFEMPFSQLYPLYLTKIERKNRTKEELDLVLSWLTGYESSEIERITRSTISLNTFFEEAPHYHENAELITGVICGYRVEEIENPLMKKIRQMDKLVDELAKGRKIEKILRTSEQ